MEQPISTDNPVTSAADNPTEPAANVNGTGSTNGQGQGAPPADDIFKGVDPSRLPPEAKAAYDSMLKDYRDKTARISETTKTEVQKAVEAYRQKAEFYDQMTQQEEFVKQWNDFVQKAGSATNGNPEDPVSQLQSKLKEFEQKLQASEMGQVADAFADAKNEKGEPAHPDFDKLNNIVLGKTNRGEASLLKVCLDLTPGKNPQERLTNAYKSAKGIYDAIFEEGKKAGLGRVQAKVANGSNPPSSVNGNLQVSDKRPKTAREAMEMARKGIVVSRT